MIGKVDHRSRRKLGLVLLQGNLGGAWGPRARTRGLQLTLCRHKEESREGGEQACHHHHNRHKSHPDVRVDVGLQVISSWGKEFYRVVFLTGPPLKMSLDWPPPNLLGLAPPLISLSVGITFTSPDT